MVVLVIALVAAVAVGGVWWALRDTPEKGARRYFEKLRYASVADMTQYAMDAPAPGSAAATVASGGPGDDFVVLSTTTSGPNVTVTYQAPWGSTETAVVPMVNDGGTWKVSKGMAEVTLRSASRLPLRLAGGLEDLPTDVPVKVWPGNHSVALGRDDPSVAAAVLQAATPPIALRPGEKKVVDVVFALSARGREAVQGALGDAFKKCMGPSAVGTNCPASVARPPGMPSDFYWAPGDSGGIYRATVADGQPLDNTCGTFQTTVTGHYRQPGGGPGTTPAVNLEVTGCVDARRIYSDKRVSWR